MQQFKHAHRETQAIFVLAVALVLFLPTTVKAAGIVGSLTFEIDPALPVMGDPGLGYSDVDPSATIPLPGGTPIDDNDFFYPAVRLGKFELDPGTLAALFPIANDANGLAATSISLGLSITDLDTNVGDSDFEDIIFALSLNSADDGTTLARVLSDKDGSTNTIAPQFITGLGNQPLTAPPDTAVNTYDLTIAPILGSNIAEMFSNSNGEMWLYLIDTDDFGNNISLANSLASDFSLSVQFAEVAAIPIPPAVLLFASAVLPLLTFLRNRT